jgi:hypothetical protein
MRESAGCAPARSTIIGEPEAAPIPFRRSGKDDGRSLSSAIRALKHGLYTRGAIEERRQLPALMRQSRMLTQQIK